MAYVRDASHILQWVLMGVLSGRRRGRAKRAPAGAPVEVSLKVAGIHWWYRTRSHAAELTAGYYNTAQRDGYNALIEVLNLRLKYNLNEGQRIWARRCHLCWRCLVCCNALDKLAGCQCHHGRLLATQGVLSMEKGYAG